MMDSFISITKALSDPNRIRILMALRGGELCVCRIIELLNLAPSTVSQHLVLLKTARLIEGRKEGRWMHYRLPDPSSEAWSALNWVITSMGGAPEIKEDHKRMKRIRELDLTALTQIYKKGASR